MSDSTVVVLGVITGLVALGLLGLGALALWLGRPLRAHGRALLYGKHEFAVAVEVPEAQRGKASASKALPPPLKAASSAK